jgi:hypothetical protein
MHKLLLAVTVAALPWFITTASAIEVKVHDDEFYEEVEYTTPEVKSKTFTKNADDEAFWIIDSSKNKETGKVTNRVFIFISYQSDGWRFYDAANLKGGKQLKFSVYKREPLGACIEDQCAYIESFVITIPNAVMKKSEKVGFAMKIAGKNVFPIIIEVSPDHVASMNEATGL